MNGYFWNDDIRQYPSWRKCCFFVFVFSFFSVWFRCMKCYISWLCSFHGLERVVYFDEKCHFFRTWISRAYLFRSVFFSPTMNRFGWHKITHFLTSIYVFRTRFTKTIWGPWNVTFMHIQCFMPEDQTLLSLKTVKQNMHLQ